MQESCKNKKMIGQILFERGLVTSAQLDEALLAQQKASPGEFVGEILVSMGYVNEIDVVTALVLQCGLSYIAVSRHDIDPKVLALIPSDMARSRRLVPLDRIGNVLTVVMQNPMNESVRDAVEQVTGCFIATFISTRSEIDRALNRFYPEAS